jgi:hypothetical protein
MLRFIILVLFSPFVMMIFCVAYHPRYFQGALSRYQAGKVAAELIATDPNRFGKLTGWHTAGINVAGSFLLGGISAAPSIDVAKVNGGASSPPASPKVAWQQFQGLSPRTKLMMGVGFCGR